MNHKIFNTDNQTVTTVHRSELYGTLKELEDKGATISLDYDNDIMYSFEDEGYEGESIEKVIEMAKYY